MSAVRRPTSYAEVLETFGDIHKFIRDDGTISPKWEEQNIVRIQLPQTIPFAGQPHLLISKVACHRLVAPSLLAVFKTIHDCELWHLLKSYGGGYVFRPVRGRPHQLSLHSFGIAVDLNPETNKLGTKGDMPAEIIEIFEDNGWFWGGRFKARPDPMHMQFAVGC